MTREENDIMKNAYYFLRDHIDPPARGTPECAGFWDEAAQKLTDLGIKWKNHPLAVEVLTAIYSYIEQKWNQKTGGAS